MRAIATTLVQRPGENLADSIEGSALQLFRAGFYDGGVEEHQHNRRVESAVIDTAIVGGGVAGLSAALFLARAGRSTTVYDGGHSRILAVERVREYVGFDGWTPGQLLARAREEALHYGARFDTRSLTR